MTALILMYHDLAHEIESVSPTHRPYVIAPAVFERQLESLVESGLQVLTVSELCMGPKPARGLVLTFDDGHVSNHRFALPILQRFGLKATFFITAGRIGMGDTMDWTQVRELHAAGMEIGSHTLTHRPPSTLDDKEIWYELSESRRVLEQGLGTSVNAISSPTGFFNARMCDIAQKVGYRALCMGRVGLVPDDGDSFSLNRIAVKRDMNRRQFEALLSFDRLTIASFKSRQWARDLARGWVGPDTYLRVRKIIMKGIGRVKYGS